MLNSLDVLSRVIIEDAYREANLIIEHARGEAAKIERSAIIEVNNLKKGAKSSLTRAAILSKKGRVISLSEFKSRCEILAHKEKYINNILLNIKKEFFAIVKGKRYQQILERLIHEAVLFLSEDADEFVCQSNKNDWKLLQTGILGEIAKNTEKKISIDKNSIEIVGGAVIYTADYRVLYDNSFEAIFERAKGMMRFIAAEALFGNN